MPLLFIIAKNDCVGSWARLELFTSDGMLFGSRRSKFMNSPHLVRSRTDVEIGSNRWAGCTCWIFQLMITCKYESWYRTTLRWLTSLLDRSLFPAVRGRYRVEKLLVKRLLLLRALWKWLSPDSIGMCSEFLEIEHLFDDIWNKRPGKSASVVTKRGSWKTGICSVAKKYCSWKFGICSMNRHTLLKKMVSV